MKMSDWKTKPPQIVIDYFETLGFEYKVVTDSIFTDKRDAPVHYFQTKGANGFDYCSTILADEATKIFRSIQEPLTKKVERVFGSRCKNGHLLLESDCRRCKKPDGRTNRANYQKAKA